MARLPQPGSDNGTWGDILNEYLSQALKNDGTLKDNVVTSSAIAPNAVTATEIQNGTITESQLDGAVQAKLNAMAGTPEWDDITGKPAVIAAGADQVAARTAIGAGTSNLALGTTGTTAKAGDYAPAWGDVTGKPSTFAPAAHSHAIADTTGLQAAIDGKAATVHTHTAAQISDATTVGRSVLTAASAAAARDSLGVTAAISQAVSQQMPYVSQLNKWRTAVARRHTYRSPRLLVIGDSATSSPDAWQHQLAGRRYFDPHRASETQGDLDTPFANGLYTGQSIRFNDMLGVADIDLLIAPDAAQPGQYRYDEGSWRTAWIYGTHWSTTYPTIMPIDRFHIDDMNGANALTVRVDQDTGNTWWYGFMARVSDAPLDVMALSVPGVTSKWWRDRLTDPADTLEFWGSSTPRALADGFDPDLIVIALGANDLDDPAIVNDVNTHLTEIIGVVRGLHPNADIALQTYWQPSWGVVRDQVLATAVAQNVALLDFWPHIPPYAYHPSLYSDQWHLGTAGQRLLADMAIQQLGIPYN